MKNGGLQDYFFCDVKTFFCCRNQQHKAGITY